MCVSQQHICGLVCIASWVQPICMQVPIFFLHSVDGSCAEYSTRACVHVVAGATSFGKPSLRKFVPASQPQLSSALPAALADATGIEVLLASLMWCINNYRPCV